MINNKQREFLESLVDLVNAADPAQQQATGFASTFYRTATDTKNSTQQNAEPTSPPLSGNR